MDEKQNKVDEIMPKTQEEQKALHSIFEILFKAKGVDFFNYRQNSVVRRVTRRIGICKQNSFKEYQDLLINNPEEIELLYHDLLLSFTEFFREPATFKSLKEKVFPEIIKNKSTKSLIKIWVPGCSTGEEVYSLAICLYEFLGNIKLKIPFQIFGTDLVEKNIDIARAAIYPEKCKKNLSQTHVERYFEITACGLKVAKFIREMCVFATQDVTQDPPFSKIDLVSCRNMLIYFSTEFQEQTLLLFHFSLKPDCFLLLGSSEALGDCSYLFNEVDQKANIYSKRVSSVKPRYRFPFSSNISKTTIGATRRGVRNSSNLDISDQVDKILIDCYAPSSVLIDCNMQIRQFRGQTSPYLEPATGDASLKLSKMAKDGLMPDLYVAIEEVRRTSKRVTKKNVTFSDGNNSETATVNLSVLPIFESPSDEVYYLILFEEIDEPVVCNPKSNNIVNDNCRDKDNENEIKRLSVELQQAKEHMQTIIEEKDEVNQELWSANEEVQATNEELQSLNEEMEAAKEELEASNEELRTLNEELKNKNNEVVSAMGFSESLLETANVLVVTLDSNLKIIRFNKCAEEVTGYKKDEIIGKNWIDIFIPKYDSKSIPGIFSKALDDFPELSYYENNILLKNGEERLIGWRNSVLKDAEKNIIGMLSIGTDISENRKLEEQLRQSEKMQVIGQLAGGIAHDFNNHLAGIMGYADILNVKYRDDPEVVKYAQKIIMGSENASSLTSQLLAFARKGKYLSIPVDIHQAIDEVIDILAHTIDKNIAITKVFFAESSIVLGDPKQLQNVLLNICLNARDAMPDGGKLIFETEIISLSRKDLKSKINDVSCGQYLVVSITDTGCGIGEDVKKHIFEPFFTTKDIGQGAGMGLASVYGAIENHNGFIEVESTCGEGSSFRVFLKILESKMDECDEKFVSTKKGKASILLVDDEEVIREIASGILSDSGYTVDVCCDGQEAVTYFKENYKSIDLVILDIIMPVMNGRQCFSEMKKIDDSVRVLVSSGYSLEGEGQKILDMGAKGFIQKPFRSHKLLKAIEENLDS